MGVPRQGGLTIDRWAGHWISAHWVGAPKEGGVRPEPQAPGCHAASFRARSFNFWAVCFARSPDPRGSTRLGMAWSVAAPGAPSPCSVPSLPRRACGFWWTSATMGMGLQSPGVGTPTPIPRCWDFTPQAHFCSSVPGASLSGGLPASRVSTSSPHFQNVLLETTVPTLPPTHRDPQSQNQV